jgi:hypothetical protein
MTKRQLIEALAEFDDDDHIMLDDQAVPYAPRVRVICGGRQDFMPYYCVRSRGHEGRCYSASKDVWFDREVPGSLNLDEGE